MMRWLKGSIVLLLLAVAFIMLVALPYQMSFAVRTPLTTSPADQGVKFEQIKLQPADARIELDGWWMPAPRPTRWR
jgi:hypothetical protein